MNSESMMTACAYNEKASGSHYEEKDLSFPFSSTAPGSVKRVFVTTAFQLASKTLDVDGALGPQTFSAIKALNKPKKETAPKAEPKKKAAPKAKKD